MKGAFKDKNILELGMYSDLSFAFAYHPDYQAQYADYTDFW